MSMEEKPGERFYRCPFCLCIFLTRADLEKHMAAFGSQKEQHLDEFRRCHSRAEYASEDKCAYLEFISVLELST
jgi:uncharacterized C2H2 Zn-finger protein